VVKRLEALASAISEPFWLNSTWNASGGIGDDLNISALGAMFELIRDSNR
jgi:hypothetical protein